MALLRSVFTFGSRTGPCCQRQLLAIFCIAASTTDSVLNFGLVLVIAAFAAAFKSRVGSGLELAMLIDIAKKF